MIKLLIADDNPSIRLCLNVIFKTRGGYSLLSASTGKETLEAVERENPDLILLDVVIPDIDGWEIARRLKEKNSAARIIFITGSEIDEKLLESIKSSGAKGFITKPFDARKLEDEIKKMVPELYKTR